MVAVRRLPRRLLLLFFLILAGALAAWALGRTVLPVKARDWLERSASEALGRKVTVGRVTLHLWHGFVAEQVRVEEDPRFGKGPFLQAGKISGGILILPLLKDRQVIIPTLHLHGLTVRLTQDAQGVWNVQGLQRQPPGRQRTRLRIPRIVLSDGRILLATARLRPAEQVEIRGIEAEVHLRLPARVEGTAKAHVRLQETLPADAGAEIALTGSCNLQDQSVELSCRSSGRMEALAAFLSRHLRSPVRSAEGTLSCDLRAAGKLPGPLTIEARMESRQLRWEAAAGAEPVRGQGDLRLSARTQVATLRKPEFLTALEGSLQLNGVSAGPFPQIQELRQVEGHLNFDARGIRTERLTAALPGGTPVEMSGSIANDAERSFGIRAAATVRLEDPPALPANLRTLLAEKKAGGPVQLEIVGNGTLRPRFKIATRVTARLGEVRAELGPGMPLALEGGGLVRWQPDLVTFTGLQGRLADRPVQLEGSVVRHAQPELTGTLSWGDLSAEAHLSLTEETVEIESLTGRAGQGNFRILGQIGRAAPEANLYGEGTFRLEELAALWPAAAAEGGRTTALWRASQEWIRKHSLEGELSVRCSLEGNLKRLDQCDLEARASSPSLRAGKLQLEQLSIQLRRGEGSLSVDSASARVAGGFATLTGSWNLAQEQNPWSARISLERVELEELGRQLDWKAQRFSGQLSAEWAGQGRGADPAAVTGEGGLEVTGAQILEFPLLGGFADFLALPTLHSIQFQEAQGSFRVKGGRVETESLQLKSPRATLTIAGWGGFLQGAESPIRWKILPTLSPELLPEESRSKIGRAITKGASYFLGEVQLTGTWKQPKRKFVPKPVMQILNEQVFNLEDLLKDLF